MKDSRFEDLPVWQAATDFGLRILPLTDDARFGNRGDLRSHLRRAALFVSSDIAEGFERGTTSELLSFLCIARGSAGAVRIMLLFSERLDGLENLESQISDLKALAESCSRQVCAWDDSLQNADIRGQRRVNEQVREEHAPRRCVLEATRCGARRGRRVEGSAVRPQDRRCRAAAMMVPLLCHAMSRRESRRGHADRTPVEIAPR